ncbi:hypothetical protein [Tissierella creatinophila]|nr:hypothetical protein [Tissierella creatinophila]
MNKILLINRINTKDFQEEKKRIFFLIGDMENKDTEAHLMDTLNSVEFLVKKDIVYKYNGVEIPIEEKNIPKMIKVLIEADINIYSVYELYDPI